MQVTTNVSNEPKMGSSRLEVYGDSQPIKTIEIPKEIRAIHHISPLIHRARRITWETGIREKALNVLFTSRLRNQTNIAVRDFNTLQFMKDIVMKGDFVVYNDRNYRDHSPQVLHLLWYETKIARKICAVDVAKSLRRYLRRPQDLLAFFEQLRAEKLVGPHLMAFLACYMADTKKTAKELFLTLGVDSKYIDHVDSALDAQKLSIERNVKTLRNFTKIDEEQGKGGKFDSWLASLVFGKRVDFVDLPLYAYPGGSPINTDNNVFGYIHNPSYLGKKLLVNFSSLGDAVPVDIWRVTSAISEKTAKTKGASEIFDEAVVSYDANALAVENYQKQ